MPPSRILREKAVGETRWVAQLGTITECRIRAIHERQGGAFVQLAYGPEAFLRLAEGHRLTEGQSIAVKIAAEARRGKLARVQLIDAAPEKGQAKASAADLWLSRLSHGASVTPEDVPVGDPNIQAAFDEALSETVTLHGGGTLRIQPTAAIVAVDLDTSAARVAVGEGPRRRAGLRVADKPRRRPQGAR